jgi:cytochrome c oxidase cbb3-type subunit 4
MDINTVRGLSTIFVAIAFFGVCWWAYSPKRKKGFDEAANLPFADEKQSNESARSDNEQDRGE